MLNFIKKFFKKEEEIIERIAKEGLIKWFEERVKGLDSEIKEKRQALSKDISNKITAAREALKALEEAKLQNPNISVREKQFMEGNRKAYLQKTEHFFREVEEIIEHEINFFVHHYKDYLDNFGKGTSRAYSILNEFFSNEARGIALRIKELDNIIEGIKKDEKMHSHGVCKYCGHISDGTICDTDKKARKI